MGYPIKQDKREYEQTKDGSATQIDGRGTKLVRAHQSFPSRASQSRSQSQTSSGGSRWIQLRQSSATIWSKIWRCSFALDEPQEGMNAILPRHGGGAAIKYGVTERERILQEARRKPTPEADGAASWSLSLLCQALRKAPDGLPAVSEDTIRTTLLEAGFSWQNKFWTCGSFKEF